MDVNITVNSVQISGKHQILRNSDVHCTIRRKMVHENVTKLLCMLQALAIQLAENVIIIFIISCIDRSLFPLESYLNKGDAY